MVPRDAGVVDQDVEPAEPLVQLAEDLVDGFAAGHVAAQCLALTASLFDLGDRLATDCLVEHVDGDHVCPGAGQRDAERASDAAEAAGHDRYAIVQLEHDPLFVFSGPEARERAPFGHRFVLVRYQRTIALPQAKPPPSAQNRTF